MTNLYQLNQQFQEVVNNADELTGEINIEALDQLTLAISEKRENVVKYILHLENDQVAIKNEIERLKKLKESAKRQAGNLKDYLRTSLEIEGVKSANFGTSKISIRNNPPKVVVTDETAITELYLNQKFITTVDKVKIKSDIQKGVEVPGVHLESTTSLTIK